MDKDLFLALAHRKLAQKGGRARARALSRDERRRIARLGGRAGGRGRRKVDRIPPDLAEKIWALIDQAGASAVWYMPPAMKRPQSRLVARQVMRAIACNGSLEAYKSAHQLLKCL